MSVTSFKHACKGDRGAIKSPLLGGMKHISAVMQISAGKRGRGGQNPGSGASYLRDRGPPVHGSRMLNPMNRNSLVSRNMPLSV